MAAVSFSHISKTYPNGYLALDNLNLEIRDGELMVIVGPSGCGKSTLLRILAGLEDISSGTLIIGGRVANSLSPQARNIAMVFQDYALYPTMTVRANLAFPLRMRKLKSADIARRVDWVAGLLDLGKVLDRLPRQLSGGQRQRVAMGRALVREPSVFLLDEPLSNLDAKLRAQVRAEIGELQQRTGATMVYVTHDQVEAMTLGERITVLNHGRIQQVADPRTLYETPANGFVAGFIGSPPMNVFEATLLSGESGVCQLTVNGESIALVTERQQATVVRAGIRPEALRLVGEDDPGFSARVVTAEYLGHETLLHFQPGSIEIDTDGATPWIARLPGMHPFERGTLIRFAPLSDQIRLFGAA
ncbi:MAG: ABC transporter ATP-binding protein [Methylococcaceae bacterium]|jgi:multiple sugar transport system ATP-binding protein